MNRRSFLLSCAALIASSTIPNRSIADSSEGLIFSRQYSSEWDAFIYEFRHSVGKNIFSYFVIVDENCGKSRDELYSMFKDEAIASIRRSIRDLQDRK